MAFFKRELKYLAESEQAIRRVFFIRRGLVETK